MAVSGLAQFGRNLQRRMATLGTLMENVVHDGAKTVHLEALRSIAENEAPGSRDADRVSQKIVIVGVAPLAAQIVSEAPESAALEFGTSDMEERPFMRPAAQKARKKIRQNAKDALKQAMRRR